MTKREEQIGAAMAEEIAAQFQELNMFDLLQLKAAYAGRGWESLSPALRKRFADLGVKFLQRLQRIAA